MGKFIIHTEGNPEKLEAERSQRFLYLPLKDKLNQLFALIHLSVLLNGGKPLKEPQGKGIIIRKPR